MKVSFFETGRDQMPVPLPAQRPAAPANYARKAGDKACQAMIERLEYVESIGFDWASLSEHHYSPRILTPSPIVSAAYVAAKQQGVVRLRGPQPFGARRFLGAGRGHGEIDQLLPAAMP